MYDRQISTSDISPPAQSSRGETSFENVTLHRLMASSRGLRVMTLGLMSRLELAIMGGHKDRAVLRAIGDARRGRESLLSANEAFTLHSLARAQAGMDGVMAEVGVYEGCSAKIISSASGGVPLHLFDTFAGLPDPGQREKARLRAGLYAASLSGVKAFLSGHRNVSYYPGVFPSSAEGCPERKFSLVHLDVDLKASTAGCLEYFYPRMLTGGIIVTHDYSYLAGVKDAFAEFFRSRAERVIELPSSQAMIVKL
jgi:O-methyltransferase